MGALYEQSRPLKVMLTYGFAELLEGEIQFDACAEPIMTSKLSLSSSELSCQIYSSTPIISASQDLFDDL